MKDPIIAVFYTSNFGCKVEEFISFGKKLIFFNQISTVSI